VQFPHCFREPCHSHATILPTLNISWISLELVLSQSAYVLTTSRYIPTIKTYLSCVHFLIKWATSSDNGRLQVTLTFSFIHVSSLCFWFSLAVTVWPLDYKQHGVSLVETTLVQIFPLTPTRSVNFGKSTFPFLATISSTK
jgi:hypothetical protein